MTTTPDAPPPADAPCPAPDAVPAPDVADDLGTGWAVGLSLAFVVLGDWLFYGYARGWTVGAYGCLLGLAVVLGACRTRRTATHDRRTGGGWQAGLLGVAFLGLCARCAVEPNRPTLMLGTACLVSLALTLREGWLDSALAWVWRWVHFVVHGVVRTAFLAGASAVVLPFVGLHPKWLRAWLIPVVLGAFFVGLFAMANPIIANDLTAAWRAFMALFDGLPPFVRILFWLVLGSAVWALLRHRSGEIELALPDLEGGLADDLAGFLTPAVIYNALALFNVLFAVQTALDLWYLWGGAALPHGLSHAQYAQRGAYPLVATALLAAAFVLITCRAGTATPELRSARRLTYLWLLQNVFLVVSAGWRLWLYVNAYSLTRLRVAAGIWMLLVACGLVWIVLRVWTGRSNLWLINVNALTLAATLYVVAWVGIDPHIANFNVRHCAEAGVADTGPADLEYLGGLGYDALPAMVWLAGRTTDPERTGEIRELVKELMTRLDQDLANWRGWTLRRAEIRATATSGFAATVPAPAAIAFARAPAAVTAPPVPAMATVVQRPDAAAVAEAPAVESIARPPLAGDAGAAKSGAALPAQPEARPATMRAVGKVVSVAPGRLTIEERGPTGDASTNVAYAVTRRAELRGIGTLADLRARDAVSVEYFEKGGRRFITLLTRPGAAGRAPKTVPPEAPDGLPQNDRPAPF